MSIIYELSEHDLDDITDQVTMADIVKKYIKVIRWEKNSAASIEALIDKITDQELLIDIVTNSYDNSFKQYIVKRISNQALLANLAKTSHEDGVRYEAVRQLSDRELLSDVIKNARGEFKQYATDRLSELPPDR